MMLCVSALWTFKGVNEKRKAAPPKDVCKSSFIAGKPGARPLQVPFHTVSAWLHALSSCSTPSILLCLDDFNPDYSNPYQGASWYVVCRVRVLQLIACVFRLLASVCRRGDRKCICRQVAWFARERTRSEQPACLRASTASAFVDADRGVTPP
eukprot:6173349-Pleurochrysis_carterae.AAC.5